MGTDFVFLGFNLDAWITIVTVFAMFSVLLFTRLRSDFVFLTAVGVLYITGVLDAKEALSGISQTSVAVVGVLSIIALRRLLPDRKTPEEAFESTGDYTVEMLIPADNPHIGKEIGEVGLNKVAGGSLVELRRYDDEQILSPVPDDEPLMGGDHGHERV